MLTESVIIASITVFEDNTIEVMEVTRILKDGEETARTSRRVVLSPGDDISGQDLKVQAVCNAVWNL